MAKKELRGTKACPKCEKRCGVRCSVCPACGAKFPVKAATVKAPKAAKAAKTVKTPKAGNIGQSVFALVGMTKTLESLTNQVNALVERVEKLSKAAEPKTEAPKPKVRKSKGLLPEVHAEPISQPKAEALAAENPVAGESVISAKVA